MSNGRVSLHPTLVLRIKSTGYAIAPPDLHLHPLRSICTQSFISINLWVLIHRRTYILIEYESFFFCIYTQKTPKNTVKSYNFITFYAESRSRMIFPRSAFFCFTASQKVFAPKSLLLRQRFTFRVLGLQFWYKVAVLIFLFIGKTSQNTYVSRNFLNN